MWADRSCAQSPGAPEQGHPWSLRASLQKQSYKYQLLPYRDGNLPQEVTGKEKICSALFPQDFTLQENSYRDILFPLSGFALCFLPILVMVDPVLTAGSGEIRQQLTMTLKNMLILRTKVKTCRFVYFFFFLRNCWKTRIQLIKYVPLKISPVGSFSNYRQAIQNVDIPETSGVCSLLSFGSKSVFSAVHVFMLLVLVGKLCWMILLRTDISWLLRKTQAWALPIYLAHATF